MEYDKKTEKCGKWDPNTVGSRIWWETLKKSENEKCTLYYLEYGEKHSKHGKWEKHTVGPGIRREN